VFWHILLMDVSLDAVSASTLAMSSGEHLPWNLLPGVSESRTPPPLRSPRR
jgi:hypothetical protein